VWVFVVALPDGRTAMLGAHDRDQAELARGYHDNPTPLWFVEDINSADLWGDALAHLRRD
jgi:hypothetical protein